MNNAKKTQRIQIGIAALLAVLIALGTISNLFALAAFLIAAAAIVGFRKTDFPVCLLFFLLSWAGIFKLDPEALTFMTHLTLLFALIYFPLKRKIDAVLIAILGFAVYCVVVQMANDCFNLVLTVKTILNLWLLYILCDKIFVEKSFCALFSYYIAGVLSASAFAYLCSISGIIDITPYVREVSVGDQVEFLVLQRFAGLYGDPNYYTVNLIIALCLAVLLFYRKFLKPVPFVLIAMALIFFSVATYSKSAFIMLVLPIVMLWYSNSKRKNIVVNIVGFLGIGVLIYLVFDGRIAAFDVVLARFRGGLEGGDVTTGRSALWMGYLTYLSENVDVLCTGTGVGAECFRGKAVHNTYIDFLYYLGVIGSCAYLGVAVGCLRKMAAKVNVRRNLLNFCVILSIMATYMALSELFYIDLPFHLCLAAIVLNMNLERPEKEQSPPFVGYGEQYVYEQR